jgi:hypothetical protein
MIIPVDDRVTRASFPGQCLTRDSNSDNIAFSIFNARFQFLRGLFSIPPTRRLHARIATATDIRGVGSGGGWGEIAPEILFSLLISDEIECCSADGAQPFVTLGGGVVEAVRCLLLTLTRRCMLQWTRIYPTIPLTVQGMEGCCIKKTGVGDKKRCPMR